ncbi:MAG: glutamine hydrolyzing CTP synthase, partial [Candidatus Thermoplasmatota archaeon]
PHITNEIMDMIKSVSKDVDVAIVELGGTVGDIESMPFLEAVRQLEIEVGHENIVFIHTTLVPVMNVVGEQKTKPTQHSVKELRAIGIHPDIIICRSQKALEKSAKEKISLFCNVDIKGVISAPDVDCVYEVPLLFEKQGLTDYLLKRLGICERENVISSWKEFVNRTIYSKNEVKIGIVGKYTDLKDAYLSHIEALTHAGSALSSRVNISWIEATDLENDGKDKLKGLAGLLIPGGFGKRGAEGKIIAINYSRINDIPFLGICFGFQLAVIEYARSVLGFKNANSTELEPETEEPVIDILPEQRGINELGGTMRLGLHKVMIKEGSTARKIYGRNMIMERHRHRYEVSPKYIEELEKNGMQFSGRSEDGKRMEILELPEKKFFIATQFHPEFLSRPNKPSPVFLEFLKNALSSSGS